MLQESKSKYVPHMAIGPHQSPQDQIVRVVTRVSSSGSDASVGSLGGRGLSPVATKFDSSLGIWEKLGDTESSQRIKVACGPGAEDATVGSHRSLGEHMTILLFTGEDSEACSLSHLSIGTTRDKCLDPWDVLSPQSSQGS